MCQTPTNVSTEKNTKIKWHNLEKQAVFKKLATTEEGLSSEEAKKRLEKFGWNKIEYEENWKIIKMILDQFKDFLIILLIVAFALSLTLGIQHTINSGKTSSEIYESIAILVIIIINITIGFVQEYKSDQALEKLKEHFESEVVVIRDGKENLIPSSKLVPGDILLIEIGDNIPADLRLIETHTLKIDEASLTGESTAVTKNTQIVDQNTRLPDRTNIAHMGTTCVYGRGEGIVINTGKETAMGEMAELTQVKKEMTPLQKSLDKFAKVIAVIVLVLACIIMTYRMIVLLNAGQQFLDALFESLSIAVVLSISAVPEGLAATITITLAIGVTRMAKRKAIISRLPAVETLGSVNYICSDKTGTLTRNEMTVKEVWTFSDKTIKVGGSGYLLEGDFTKEDKKIDPIHNKTLQLLLQAGYHCNNAGLIRNDGEIQVKGDPTEAALVVLAEKAGFTEADKVERVHEIFFESGRKRMTTINKINEEYYAFMKGSPPTIMNRCTSILRDGKKANITTDIQDEIMQANTEMSSKALRVLGVAYKKVPADFDPDDPNAIESDMTFLGLTGMIDPPRQIVKASIEECRQAGITTVMITGDQRETAVAIAKEVGILKTESDLILNGEEFTTLTDYELKEKIHRIKVYSRMDPKDKFRVVATLQELGYIVAVTGDGINDAPALKKADIGVAMGITGTDVSKEVADMIITNDAFNTIINAVEEGRTIFNNMKKFIRYALSANFDEILEVFIILALFKVLPLLPLQILFLNLLTDSLPALSLGVEPYDPKLMKQPPSDRKNFLRDIYGFAGLTGLLALIASLGDFLVGYGIPQLGFQGIGRWRILRQLDTGTIPPGYELNDYVLAYAQLISFTATIVFELIFIFIARCDNDTSFLKSNPYKSKWLLRATGLSWILVLFVVYFPPLQFVFTSFPPGFYYILGWFDWLVILSFTLGVNIIIEALRYLLRHPKMHRIAKRVGMAVRYRDLE